MSLLLKLTYLATFSIRQLTHTCWSVYPLQVKWAKSANNDAREMEFGSLDGGVDGDGFVKYLTFAMQDADFFERYYFIYWIWSLCLCFQVIYYWIWSAYTWIETCMMQAVLCRLNSVISTCNLIQNHQLHENRTLLTNICLLFMTYLPLWMEDLLTHDQSQNQ